MNGQSFQVGQMLRRLFGRDNAIGQVNAEFINVGNDELDTGADRSQPSEEKTFIVV
jgi:hypothetical protein